MEKQETQPSIEAKGLNENHKRFLSTTFCLLEENMDNAERMLDHPPCGKLYATVDDLTDAQKEEIRKRVRLIRECVHQYAGQFDLYPEKNSLYRAIRAMFYGGWMDVCELEPKSLKGYGEVGKDIYDSVMECARELEELLSHI